MDRIGRLTERISAILNLLAGISLTLMMFLTVFDVALRAGGNPIVGTYEIVSLMLALVIGFSIPQVSLDGAHVSMDIGLNRFSSRGQCVVKTVTRLFCIGLFLFIGYNLFAVGNEFRAAGEVSQTLRLPFYPVAYSVGICSFLECFVLALQIPNTWRSEHV
jgi:TRAP-type C4-dicarboxylate transport system permease small subunit